MLKEVYRPKTAAEEGSGSGKASAPKPLGMTGQSRVSKVYLRPFHVEKSEHELKETF